MVIFIWTLAYVDYLNGDFVIPIIIIVIGFLAGRFFFKQYKNKPISNKLMDSFVVIMCILGLVVEDSPLWLGGITLLTALIDLAFCIYADYNKTKNI